MKSDLYGQRVEGVFLTCSLSETITQLQDAVKLRSSLIGLKPTKLISFPKDNVGVWRIINADD